MGVSGHSRRSGQLSVCACMSDRGLPDPYCGIWLVPRAPAKLSGPAARQVSSQLTSPNPPACTVWLLRPMEGAVLHREERAGGTDLR
eukprot:4081903-Prymnesium_polylepis.1